MHFYFVDYAGDILKVENENLLMNKKRTYSADLTH
jgi:hypothetical protein